ncbi:MAG: RNA polymerase sigma factor [Clostridiales bacterium]|nr:RNA polymerase sigma factor [Clostridiales bacterium]
MKKEWALVRRAKEGDVEAFGQLYEQIYREMYYFALYVLKHPQDAEDVVSDTVTSAFVSLKKLKKEEAFRSWIFRILSNKCKDYLREYVRRSERIDEMAPESKEWDKNVSMEDGGESRILVNDILDHLEDEERMIISMHLFAGYRETEIAELLGLKENTVRSKKSRALKKLLKCFDENNSKE